MLTAPIISTSGGNSAFQVNNAAKSSNAAGGSGPIKFRAIGSSAVVINPQDPVISDQKSDHVVHSINMQIADDELNPFQKLHECTIAPSNIIEEVNSAAVHGSLTETLSKLPPTQTPSLDTARSQKYIVKKSKSVAKIVVPRVSSHNKMPPDTETKPADSPHVAPFDDDHSVADQSIDLESTLSEEDKAPAGGVKSKFLSLDLPDQKLQARRRHALNLTKHLVEQGANLEDSALQKYSEKIIIARVDLKEPTVDSLESEEGLVTTYFDRSAPPIFVERPPPLKHRLTSRRFDILSTSTPPLTRRATEAHLLQVRSEDELEDDGNAGNSYANLLFDGKAAVDDDDQERQVHFDESVSESSNEVKV